MEKKMPLGERMKKQQKNFTVTGNVLDKTPQKGKKISEKEKQEKHEAFQEYRKEHSVSPDDLLFPEE